MSTAKSRVPGAKVSMGVWLGGLAVRTVFIAFLIAVTARVARPQMEEIRTLLDTPADLLRVGLGLAVCLWLFVHIFIPPKDAGGYRTWLFLGLALLPLSALCAFYIW